MPQEGAFGGASGDALGLRARLDWLMEALGARLDLVDASQDVSDVVPEADGALEAARRWARGGRSRAEEIRIGDVPRLMKDYVTLATAGRRGAGRDEGGVR